MYWICSIVLLLLQYFNTFYQICMKVLDISILRTLLSVSGEEKVLTRAPILWKNSLQGHFAKSRGTCKDKFKKS